MSVLLGCTTITAGLSTRPLSPDAKNNRIEMASQSSSSTGRNIFQDISSEVPLLSSLEKTQRESSKWNRENNNPWWVFLYIPGLVIGLVGLGMLVRQSWDNHTVRVITYLMWGIPGGLLALFACCLGVLMRRNMEAGMSTLIIGVIGAIGILGAFYSDWILGAVAQNYTGLPSGDNTVLYWGYIVAKQLPLGSF